MYNVKMFLCSEECGWLREARRVYIRSCNKMVALGYAYTL